MLDHVLHYTSRLLVQKLFFCHNRLRTANSFLIREFHGIKTSQLALDVNTFDNIIDAGTANVTHVRTAKVFAEWACRAVPEAR